MSEEFAEFAEALEDLIDRYSDDMDEVISALELKLEGLKEEQADKQESE